MSVLSVPEAMPNRIRTLAEVVTAEKNLNRSQLARRLVPGVDKLDQFNSLLRESIRLGVVTEDDKTKLITLGADITAKEVVRNDLFLRYCRSKLISAEIEHDTGAWAFQRALAWFLTRPVGMYLKFGAEYQTYLLNDLNENEIYELSNASRSDMLAYWAHALGFAEWLVLDGQTYCSPDPTRATAVALPGVLPRKESTPISHVIQLIANALPVFEGGIIRSEVEARLKKPRQEGYLSRSTSLALYRLQTRGTIELERQSDAPPLLLVGIDGNEEPISHLKLLTT